MLEGVYLCDIDILITRDKKLKSFIFTCLSYHPSDHTPIMCFDIPFSYRDFYVFALRMIL